MIYRYIWFFFFWFNWKHTWQFTSNKYNEAFFFILTSTWASTVVFFARSICRNFFCDPASPACNWYVNFFPYSEVPARSGEKRSYCECWPHGSAGYYFQLLAERICNEMIFIREKNMLFYKLWQLLGKEILIITQ